MPKRTKSYNSWRLSKLTDPEVAASYVNAAISDSPEMFLKALRNVAQARQMTKVAKTAGVTRENLYRAFSDEGNPTLDTLSSVLRAVGLKLIVGTESCPLPKRTIPGTVVETESCSLPKRTGKAFDCDFLPRRVVANNFCSLIGSYNSNVPVKTERLGFVIDKRYILGNKSHLPSQQSLNAEAFRQIPQEAFGIKQGVLATKANAVRREVS